MLSCESEIKINQQWHLVELVNITDKEFILKLKGEDESIKYKTNSLILKKPSCSSFTSKPAINVSYNLNQQIEFYFNNKWLEGRIKAQKGLFYLIDYNDNAMQCNRIIGFDSIRELTSSSHCITIDIDKCVRISLKKWSTLTYPSKKINKLIDKLNKLLYNVITFIFSANFTLFVFGENIEIELLNDLITTAFEHFSILDKETLSRGEDTKCILNTTQSQDNNTLKDNADDHNSIHKETIVIEKLIYDMQKPKIDQLKKTNQSLKIEVKLTKNSNEVNVSISSKDFGLFTEAKNMLNLILKYLSIPLEGNNPFFASCKGGEKNLAYFADLYQIVDYNCFKNDEKSTTIRLIGQSEMIDYFTRSVISFCEKNELLKERENTIAQLKNQILK